jgi:hypothetical protein
MPGELSTYGARISLDYATGRAVEVAAPATTYLALLTAIPTDDTTMAQLAEVTTAGYGRPTTAWTAATATSPSTTQNSGLLSFGALTADMVSPAVALALVTVATGTAGQIRMWWELDQPMQLLNGQTLQVAPGALTMSLT